MTGGQTEGWKDTARHKKRGVGLKEPASSRTKRKTKEKEKKKTTNNNKITTHKSVSKGARKMVHLAQIPKAPKAPKPKSPKAQEPKSPKAQKPKSPKAQKPKSPRAQKPQSPKAPKPKSPKAQKPKSPKAQKPQSPKAQKPKSRSLTVLWSNYLGSLSSAVSSPTREQLRASSSAFLCARPSSRSSIMIDAKALAIFRPLPYRHRQLGLRRGLRYKGGLRLGLGLGIGKIKEGKGEGEGEGKGQGQGHWGKGKGNKM